jgi:hypothetical protein
MAIFHRFHFTLSIIFHLIFNVKILIDLNKVAVTESRIDVLFFLWRLSLIIIIIQVTVNVINIIY